MPAHLSAAPGHAASAAQNILHPASAAASGLATAADTPAGDHAPSFAALFRQLAAAQSAGDAGRIVIALQEAPLAAPEEATTDALSALLPFLEGMGMIQTGSDVTDTSAAEDPMALLAAETSVTPLAVPVTDTAITAATLPTEDGDAEGTGIAPASSPVLPLSEDAADTVASGITDPQNEKTALAATQAGVQTGQAQGAESGRGREFAAQLVAAIENSREGAQTEGGRTPGSTSAAVHQVLAATPSNGSAHSASAATLQVAPPVGTPGWSEEVGNRIVWMANRMESRAELVLTPPQMGRVEVSLTISGDQASANFVSANPAVREALESALPRLREVLADAGIQLGQAQVGAENSGQSARSDKNGDNPGFDRAGERDAGLLQMTEMDMSSPAGLKSGRGLVDVFA